MRSFHSRLLALSFAIAIGLIGCNLEKEKSATRPTCQIGQREDRGRAGRVISLLATTSAGRAVLQRARMRWQVCFGPAAASAAMEGGTLTLAEEESDAECAARLGHLLLHFVEGDPVAEGLRRSQACSSVVRDAVRAEARAHALELELRRELGVVHARRAYAFEQDFWKAPAQRRVELLSAYFFDHPRGGAGLPGFVEAFRRRCSAASRRAPVP